MKTLKRLARLGVVILAALIFSIEAQSTWATDPSVNLGRWINYGASTPGYPSGYMVTSVAVDGDENLWIGTEGGGIARYDGTFWTRITVANTSSALISDFINVVSADGDHIWVGTNSGVSHYDSNAMTWESFTSATGLPSNIVNAIDFSWIGSWPNQYRAQYFATPSGLAQHFYDGGHQWHTYTVANSDLVDNHLMDIAFQENGTLWIATIAGVQKVVGALWTTYTNTTPGCGVIESATSIAIDEKGGRVWFGTDRTWGIDQQAGLGACVHHTASNTWQRFYSGNSGLGDDTVKDLTVDSEGRVWFGTDPFYAFDPGGVYVCTWANNTCNWKAYGTSDGLSSKKVHAVGASLDRLWFGTEDAGLSSFALHWAYYSDNAVNTLAYVPGQLWVGTATELKRFNGTSWTTLLPSVDVEDLLILEEGQLWVGTDGNGLRYYDGSSWTTYNTSNSELVSDHIYSLTRDMKGRIWIGTAGYGLNVYDPKAKSWNLFTPENSPLPSFTIMALAVDEEGQVWVGTDQGIGVYTGKDWDHHDQSSGLPNTYILALEVDSLGRVWAGTSTGPAYWNGSTWTAPNLGIGGVKAIDAAPDGKIWVGASVGAGVYDGSKWTIYRSRNSGLINDSVDAIAADGDQGAWFGTSPGYVGPIPKGGGVYVRGQVSDPLGLPSPTITGFTPASGVADTEVTITGTNFDARGPSYNKVEFRMWGFDHWAKASVTSATQTQVKAKVPPQAIQGEIRVTTAGGTATSSTNFNPIPKITSVKPTSGALGVPVDIYGTNFDSPTPTEVRFGSGSWISLLTIQKYNHIRLPVSGASGYVQVRTASGTATSPSQFSLSTASVKVFGWQVHQGVPVGQLLVAEKSTVVRFFIGTDTAGSPIYVDGAHLRIYDMSQPYPTLTYGSIPNKGLFSNTSQQFGENGSVDFFIPGSQLPPGAYLFQVELYAGNNLLVDRHFGQIYHFEDTDDIKVHASIPGTPASAEQNNLMLRQLKNLNRAYPVRDGIGPIGSSNGFQYATTPYKVCDGTKTAACPKTGYLWDFWQDKSSGQLQAKTRKNDLANTSDNGDKLTYTLGTVKKGEKGSRKFLARLRPSSKFPVGTTNVITKFTIDCSNLSGSPDASTQVSLPVTRTAHTGAPSIGQSNPSAWDTSSAETPSFTLTASHSSDPVFDTDGSKSITPGDVVEFVITFENTGSADAKDVKLVGDYDQKYMDLYGSGGMMLGSGGTFDTRLIPGKFFSAWGWLAHKHDKPFDEDYDGVIDPDDLKYFVVEFDDWNPATGEITVSTDLTKLDPGEVVRNFQDSNDNGKHDSGEKRGQYAQRFDNHNPPLWDHPWNLFTAYNNKVPTSQQAEFSSMWFLKGINAIMDPGTGNWPGKKTWADVTDNTSFIHELGHNFGQVSKYSPNSSGGSHSKNKHVQIPSAYDLLGKRVLTGNQLLSVMYPNVLWPVEQSFFEVVEYFDIYNYLRWSTRPKNALSPQADGTYLVISGQIHQSGEVSISNSYLGDDLQTSNPNEDSPYRLVFLAGEEMLHEHPFEVQFSQRWDAWGLENQDYTLVQSETAPFYLVAPFPTGTQAVEIHKGSQLLERLQVSPAPPEVDLLYPNGGQDYGPDDVLLVEWEAWDEDGDDLKYTVRYSGDNGATWQPLTAGAVEKTLETPLGALPGGDQVLIEVEVTDGFHTSSDRSDGPISVGPKPPVSLAILSPPENAELIQSNPVFISGEAFDLEDGLLPGENLAWYSDRDGFLGSGQSLTSTLTVGVHHIWLEAIDGDGLAASTSVPITLLSDFDQDGLGDIYEMDTDQLAWWNPDDSGQDPDGDGLTNRSEADWGTNPGDPDSDSDGIPDGEEVSLGGLPGDPESQPLPPQILLSHTALSYEIDPENPMVTAQNVLVASNLPSGIEWTAASDAPWLSVEPTQGITPYAVSAAVDPKDMSIGLYTGHLTFHAGDMQVVLPVTMDILGGSRLHLPMVYK